MKGRYSSTFCRWESAQKGSVLGALNVGTISSRPGLICTHAWVEVVILHRRVVVGFAWVWLVWKSFPVEKELGVWCLLLLKSSFVISFSFFHLKHYSAMVASYAWSVCVVQNVLACCCFLQSPWFCGLRELFLESDLKVPAPGFSKGKRWWGLEEGQTRTAERGGPLGGNVCLKAFLLLWGWQIR